MASQPLPTLNDRQRHYLLAAYQLDQQIEQERRCDFARGNPDPERTPAAVWRAMPYGRWEHQVLEGKPPTPLRARLDPQLVSPGTGSTWKALAERNLVGVENRLIRLPFMSAREAYALPHVSLTRAGRKLARELLGEVRPARPRKPAPPDGLLSHQGWRILAGAYAQDEQGLVAEVVDQFDRKWDRYGSIPQHQLEGLVAQGLLAGLPAGAVIPERYCLTAAGLEHYVRYYRTNAAAHPVVRAEVPRPPLTSAQQAFWARAQELNNRLRYGQLSADDQRAVRHQLLQLKLAEPMGTLFHEPYWYPTLGGVAYTTQLNADPEEFRCATDAEAIARGPELHRNWINQLTW